MTDSFLAPAATMKLGAIAVDDDGTIATDGAFERRYAMRSATRVRRESP